MEMDIQLKREAMVAIFWNQMKTRVEPAEEDMYVNRLIEAVTRTQYIGTPLQGSKQLAVFPGKVV